MDSPRRRMFHSAWSFYFLLQYTEDWTLSSRTTRRLSNGGWSQSTYCSTRRHKRLSALFSTSSVLLDENMTFNNVAAIACLTYTVLYYTQGTASRKQQTLGVTLLSCASVWPFRMKHDLIITYCEHQTTGDSFGFQRSMQIMPKHSVVRFMWDPRHNEERATTAVNT